MNGAVFALLLLATGTALVWAFWPRRPGPAGGRDHPRARVQDDAEADAAPRTGKGPPLALGQCPSSPAAGAPGPSAPGASTPGSASPGPAAHGPSAPGPSGNPPPADPPPAEGEQPPPRPRAAPAPTGSPHRAPLFAYGTLAEPAAGAPDAPRHRHGGDYACVHVATTGFAAARERIVELAIVRCDADGTVRDQWTTLIDPRREEVPGGALHGITPGSLHGAPAFADVASEWLTRCEECVVVAHNAGFVESFLGAELLRGGLLAPTLPALDLSRLAPLVATTPNVRLATLARQVGRPRSVPSSALDDALTVAAALPGVLARLSGRLSYPVPPTPRTATGRHRRVAPTLPRPAGTTGVPPTGWLADLMTELAMGAAEGHDHRLAAYLDALTAVLPTGRIVSDEVHELTGAAVRAGYPAAQLRGVLERLLESMRAAAFARGSVSQDQVRHLRAAALSLGVPTYFDDLIQAPPAPAPPPGSGTFSRPVRKPLPPPPPTQAPRCGHCLQVGHYTAACPKLRRRGSRGPIGGVGGIGPIDPISPI